MVNMYDAIIKPLFAFYLQAFKWRSVSLPAFYEWVVCCLSLWYLHLNPMVCLFLIIFSCYWLNKQILGSQENVASVGAAATAAAGGGKGPESLPLPPRSAFMCYADCKKKEIMALYGILEENDSILKLVAREWRKISGTLAFACL
jgi:hypothetical protein